MTGPEHYREAERLVNGGNPDIAAAQVHATLALVAATLDGSAGSSVDHENGSIINYENENSYAWGQVIRSENRA